MLNLNLEGKTALVGGSSQGIGRAAATVLASLGANIILLARNPEALESVKQELDTSKGQNHSIIATDMGKPHQMIEEVKKFLEKQKSPVHILVNNTGGPAPGPVNEAKTEDFEAAFQQHLISNHLLAQALLPGMKEAGYGRIVNVISTSVKIPLANLGVSNTIRAAVANWSKTLSSEVAKFGITVNNVLPGATYTNRLKSIIHNRAAKNDIVDKTVEGEMMKEIPAGRFGTAEEVANAIAFLASPAAAYINGVNLPVDGGRTGCL